MMQLGCKIIATAALAAILTVPTAAQEHLYPAWKVEIVQAAHWVARGHDDAFNASLVGAAPDTARVSLDAFQSARKDAWIAAVKADVRLARAVLGAHYGL